MVNWFYLLVTDLLRKHGECCFASMVVWFEKGLRQEEHDSVRAQWQSIVMVVNAHCELKCTYLSAEDKTGDDRHCWSLGAWNAFDVEHS